MNPDTLERFEFEPFVYTSMTSRFGSAYHLVVRGRTLLRSPEEEEELVRTMRLMKEGSDGRPAHMFTAIGETAVYLRAQSIDHDWAGRPGTCVSALACRCTAGSALSVALMSVCPWENLPFIGHDDLSALESEPANAGASAYEPPARPFASRGRVLSKEDVAWFLRNRELPMQVWEALVSGRGVDVEAPDQPAALIHWLALLLVASTRTCFSYVLGLSPAVQLPADLRMIVGKGRVFRTESMGRERVVLGESTALDLVISARIINRIVRSHTSGADFEADWTAFTARHHADIRSARALPDLFWKWDVSQRVLEADDWRELHGDDVILSLRYWKNDFPQGLGSFVEKLAAGGDGPWEWADRMLAEFDGREEDLQLFDLLIARLLKSLKAERYGQGGFVEMFAAVPHVLRRIPRILAQQVAGRFSIEPMSALRVILRHKDPNLTHAWQSLLIESMRKGIESSVVLLSADEVRLFANYMQDDLPITMELIRIWPRSDAEGVTVWIKSAIQHHENLSWRDWYDIACASARVDRRLYRSSLIQMIETCPKQDRGIKLDKCLSELRRVAGTSRNEQLKLVVVALGKDHWWLKREARAEGCSAAELYERIIRPRSLLISTRHQDQFRRRVWRRMILLAIVVALIIVNFLLKERIRVLIDLWTMGVDNRPVAVEVYNG